MPIVSAYFEDNAHADRGDVHVFEFGADRGTVVAIDCYNEPTDQLDLIDLYIRCSAYRRADISKLAAGFFNAASIQVAASKASICEALRDAINGGKFPRSVGNGGFMHTQVVHRAV